MVCLGSGALAVGDSRQICGRAASSNAALSVEAPFFDADQLGAGTGERKRADARVCSQTIHGRVNGGDRHRRARAAVHLFVEMSENHAGRREQRRSGTHDFDDGAVNISIRDNGAGTDDHLTSSNGTGFKAPLSDSSLV